MTQVPNIVTRLEELIKIVTVLNRVVNILSTALGTLIAFAILSAVFTQYSDLLAAIVPIFIGPVIFCALVIALVIVLVHRTYIEQHAKIVAIMAEITPQKEGPEHA